MNTPDRAAQLLLLSPVYAWLCLLCPFRFVALTSIHVTGTDVADMTNWTNGTLNGTNATAPARTPLFWCVLHDLNTTAETNLTATDDETRHHLREYPGCVPELARPIRDFCANSSNQSALALSPMPDLPPIAALPPAIDVTTTVHVVDNDCPIIRIVSDSLRADERGGVTRYNLSFETEPRAEAVIQVYPRNQLDTTTGGFGNLSHQQVFTLQNYSSVPTGIAVRAILRSSSPRCGTIDRNVFSPLVPFGNIDVLQVVR